VESLDRLSRQLLRKSVTLFLQILDAGVHIVTVSNGYVFRAGETDLQDLMLSIASMHLAHEESRLKSDRIGAV
jgi:DNA invertase Pin-like site-specific DNA recombinase